ILTEDTQSGGPFRREKPAVENRIAGAVRDLTGAQAGYAPFWGSTRTPWDERYDEDLRSAEWVSIPRQIFVPGNFRFLPTGKLSGPGDPLQVHHLTYERVGRELLDDLITLCRSAHRRLHERNGGGE